MKFPQYLWRIATREGAICLRRGNTPDEALAKEYSESIPSGLLPIGISDHCEIRDKQRYNQNHPWDWMNS